MKGKIQSRKLWAWIVTTILMVVGVIYTGNIMPEMVNVYGIITTIYIGGNIFQKYIERPPR